MTEVAVAALDSQVWLYFSVVFTTDVISKSLTFLSTIADESGQYHHHPK